MCMSLSLCLCVCVCACVCLQAMCKLDCLREAVLHELLFDARWLCILSIALVDGDHNRHWQSRQRNQNGNPKPSQSICEQTGMGTHTHCFTLSLLHTRSFTHSLLHSFTHSLLHSFTPSLADIHTHRPLAAAAWRMDSRVWGITPSSAATTSTTMSVALAPLARMALNASCPGVSRNVMVLPLVSGTVDIWTGRENRWRFRIHETNAPFCWF